MTTWTMVILVTSMVFLMGPFDAECKPDALPSCDSIPKLLCCTERILEKCLAGCMDYITKNCAHKLHKFDKISKTPKEGAQAEEVVPVRASLDEADSDLINPPVTEAPAPSLALKKKARALGIAPSPSDGRSQGFADLPSEGFIEQPAPVPPAESRSNFGGGSVSSGGFGGSSSSSSFGGVSRSGGDYDLLNPKYPVTEVTDRDLTQECGTAQSRPPFSPCLSRKTVDDLFLSCCQQHVPSNCHSLCTYEHREHVAAETLIAAVQQDGCDLKWLSPIFYCANQNRDNRKCCEHLSLSGSELGVGDRCLRMCNVARSGSVIGTVEQNDLVCLSNWNVIMYCARSGLRTIN
jgi:hypothetical protein